eukprot:CAMPEP_0196737412 /NCGR_PEP_ID=MMETSP1091-20130531/15154_1 /TAXON_ID=302021 /ORGANISM="Rhodomonas sp., Strain CCMP768" /LENGTH=53 /DNA_ID=CAMNT_0042081259 /DNA_START=275 /DNA_END=436 /DNA_ORIENTATION=-
MLSASGSEAVGVRSCSDPGSTCSSMSSVVLASAGDVRAGGSRCRASLAVLSSV